MVAATPQYVDDRSPWFIASFGGTCNGCDTPFQAGAEIAYDDDNQIIGRCCHDGTVFDGSMLVVDTRKTPMKVMPPGKTKADRCPRCFIIHTTAQGDECQ